MIEHIKHSFVHIYRNLVYNIPQHIVPALITKGAIDPFLKNSSYRFIMNLQVVSLFVWSYLRHRRPSHHLSLIDCSYHGISWKRLRSLPVLLSRFHWNWKILNCKKNMITYFVEQHDHLRWCLNVMLKFCPLRPSGTMIF